MNLHQNRWLTEILAQARKQESFLIKARAGTGKQAPVSEPVLSPSGWVTHGDLAPGDYVIGSDGTPTEVLGVFPQTDRRVVRVTFTDGSSVRCGWEHLWTVQTEWQKAESKRTGRCYSKTLSLQEIYKDYRRNSPKRPYRYYVPSLSAPVMLGAEMPFAYFEGVMLGNGSFGSGLHLTLPTHFPLDLLSLPPSRVREAPGCNQCYFPWATLPEQVRRYQHTGQKSESKALLSSLLDYDFESRLALLQGLMDSDGTNQNQDGRDRQSFYSTSPYLLDLFKNLVRSLGGRACEPTYDGRTHYRSGFCGKVSFRLPFPASKLESKQRRTFPTYDYSSAIQNIEQLDYEEDSVCIKVAASDALYVTTNYKLTHNTTTLSAISDALPASKKLFIAFNKHNAEELGRRTSAECSTIHSLGMKMLREYFGRPQVMQDKSAGLHKKLRLPGRVIDFQQGWELFRLLGYDSETAYEGWQHVDQMIENDVTIYEDFTEALEYENLEAVKRGEIDFTDMVWSIPFLIEENEISSWGVQTLAIDEFQDTSAAAINFLAHCVDERTQVIGLGDPLQCIFKFAGAIDDAFERFQASFNTDLVLPLPVTYRCPEKVADVAREYCPDLEHFKSGGNVELYGEIPQVFEPNSLVIGRTYGELIPEFFPRKMEGENVRLRGHGFIEKTSKAVLNAKRQKRNQRKDYFEVLSTLVDDREAKLERLPFTLAAQDRRNHLSNEITALKAFGQYFESYEQMHRFSSQIDTKRPGCVTFSSIHRCKGDGNDNVYFMGYAEQKTKALKGDLETVKTNYVGVSRSSSSLYLLA